jgi:hypothetical protein
MSAQNAQAKQVDAIFARLMKKNKKALDILSKM